MAIVDIEVTYDGFKQMMNGLDWIENSGVYVGVPEDESSREDEEITNAELLFIHTNGSLINNVPARPVVEPAIKNDSARLSKMLGQAFVYALSGDFSRASDQLKKTGMRGQKVVRAWFTNPKNNWPPNSPGVATAKRKKGSTDPRPLIDTGELIRSITYVIYERGIRK